MIVDPILVDKLVVLKEEIDASIATAQAFLDYKRGDMTYDRFIMDAMELSENSPLHESTNPKHYRGFLEELRLNTLPHKSSGSALTALLEYDALFDAVMISVAGGISKYANSTLTDDEVDEMWELGVNYLMGEQENLVY
jgi:hypothetical protein